MAEGKPIKVAVEFSLEDPRGGIHFVVPDGEFLVLQDSKLQLLIISVNP